MNHRSATEPRGPHRAVIPADEISLVGTPLCVGAEAGGHASGPTVELLREGNVIRAIDITCSCGQRIRVHCSYD